MKFSRFPLLLIFVSILSLVTLAAVTPVATPVPGRQLSPPCTDAMDTIETCPNTGCGEFGDALLNQVKNKVPTATSGTPKTLAQIRAMTAPATFDTGRPRTAFQGPGKEGTVVEIKGFLLKVKPEGGESCNCGLTHRVDTDVHFAITDDPEDAESTSVTAEVTPRVRRAGHPDWVFSKLNDLEGDYVKIVGPLMLDTKHIPQANRLSGERKDTGLTRSTNWEIHPVTRLFKCTKSKSSCDHGNGWQEVP